VNAVIADIASRERVDTAWAEYREHAAKAFANRELLLDRGYMERWAALEAKFKKLSLMPRSY
jgi:hypothetical protein